MNGRLWRTTILTQLRSVRNGAVGDARFRVETALRLAALIISLMAGSFWLARRLLRVQAEGAQAVTGTLWLVIAGLWLFFASLLVVGALRQGFGTDSARLLLTLSMSPAQRFRLYVYRSLSEENGVTLLAVTLALGLVLHRVLGGSSLLWLLPFGAGLLLIVWLAALLLAVFVRYLLPHWRRLLVPVLIVLAGGEAVTLLLGGEPASLTLPRFDFPILPATLLLLLPLAVGLGPMAAWSGRCYVAAWQVLESQGTSRQARLWPGLAWLTAWLARWRGPAGALLIRSLINQSRHPLSLPRLVVLPVYGLFFPFLYPRLMQSGFSQGQSVAIFAAVMGGLLLLEYGVAYPVSAEGARLALFLSAPVGERALLWAMTEMVLLPVLLAGGGFVAGGALWLGLGIGESVTALAAVWLLLAGVVGLAAPTSAWDVDLDALPRGGAEMLLHEELPTTAQRIQLLGAAFLLLFVGLLLIRLLPGQWLLPALVVWAVGLTACGQWVGLAGLRALRRSA